MFKSMVFIGLLMAKPFSTISLQTAIVNSIFNFQTTSRETSGDNGKLDPDLPSKSLNSANNRQFFPDECYETNKQKTHKLDEPDATPGKCSGTIVLPHNHIHTGQTPHHHIRDNTLIIHTMLKEYSANKNLSANTIVQL